VYLLGIPLLLIPFAIYNIIAFLMPGVSWTNTIMSVTMVSGQAWAITPEDLLIGLSIVLLFGEIFKSARASSSRGLIDHMLSFALFMVMVVEFLLVGRAATSTFFLLLLLELVDVLSGFTIASRAARRDVAIEEAVNP
jgi:uncharacterized membrane protein